MPAKLNSLDPRVTMRARLSPRFVLAVLPAVLLAIALGFWQLDRAEQKRALEEQWYSAMARLPVRCAELARGTLAPATRVELTGRYETQVQYLLDNRTHDGAIGYEVLTRFACDSGEAVLVNRGWLEMAGRDRTFVPSWATPMDRVTLSGFVPLVPARDSDLSSERLADGSLLRVQQLGAALSNERVAGTLQLDPNAPGALVPNWSAATFNPQRHIGYAVQWFSLAAALIVWMLVHVFGIGAPGIDRAGP